MPLEPVKVTNNDVNDSTTPLIIAPIPFENFSKLTNALMLSTRILIYVRFPGVTEGSSTN